MIYILKSRKSSKRDYLLALKKKLDREWGKGVLAYFRKTQQVVCFQNLLHFLHCYKYQVSKSLQTINGGESVEKRKPSYTVGGNVNWYSHYREQDGDSSKNEK